MTSSVFASIPEVGYLEFDESFIAATRGNILRSRSGAFPWVLLLIYFIFGANIKFVRSNFNILSMQTMTISKWFPLTSDLTFNLIFSLKVVAIESFLQIEPVTSTRFLQGISPFDGDSFTMFGNLFHFPKLSGSLIALNGPRN